MTKKKEKKKLTKSPITSPIPVPRAHRKRRFRSLPDPIPTDYIRPAGREQLHDALVVLFDFIIIIC